MGATGTRPHTTATPEDWQDAKFLPINISKFMADVDTPGAVAE